METVNTLSPEFEEVRQENATVWLLMERVYHGELSLEDALATAVVVMHKASKSDAHS